MIKKILITAFIFFLQLIAAEAFEDCVITTDGKLSDISIEHNDIVDVYPLFTIMNEKNTLIVHPLKAGKTRVCVLKNGKDIVMFNIEVNENKTVIDDVDGFDIFGIDLPSDVESEPEFDFEIDVPPEIKE